MWDDGQAETEYVGTTKKVIGPFSVGFACTERGARAIAGERQKNQRQDESRE